MRLKVFVVVVAVGVLSRYSFDSMISFFSSSSSSSDDDLDLSAHRSVGYYVIIASGK